MKSKMTSPLTPERKQGILSAPHDARCKSRSVIDDTPWDTFTRPVCRSINGCGHCEKCEWRKTRPDSVHFPCDCWKSHLSDLMESHEALVEALTELRKWVEWFDHSDVQNTPLKREAKCETNYEVVEIVDAALRNAGVQS